MVSMFEKKEKKVDNENYKVRMNILIPYKTELAIQANNVNDAKDLLRYIYDLFNLRDAPVHTNSGLQSTNREFGVA